MAQLINEIRSFANSNVEIIKEDVGADKPKRLYMKGIFLEGDVRNHNRRVYPTSEIASAVESVNQRIRGGSPVLGEADHPDKLDINIDRISHDISEMWMEGNKGMGKLRILGTPCGNIVKTLLEEGIQLGVSSRGSGNVDGNGYVSDFEIITVDVVANPSAPNAYPKAIYEAFNMTGKTGPIIEDLARSMTDDASAQTFLAKELIKFLEK